MAFAISMVRGVVSDECARRTVPCQHHCAVDFVNCCIKCTHPVRAARRFPIFLFESVIFRILGVPETLPVFRAGVEKTREN
jgi:hypothetical protein